MGSPLTIIRFVVVVAVVVADVAVTFQVVNLSHVKV